MLESIRRAADPRVVIVELSLLGERFEEHYLDTGIVGISPSSGLSCSREELTLHPIVVHWVAGEPLDLPMRLDPPAPETLSARDQRRGFYLDTPLVQKQIARLRAARATD